MSKKVKVPLALRFVRWIFPKLEKYSPPLAIRLFVQLFFTPLHYGFPDKEIAWIIKSNKKKLVCAGKNIWVYSWGDESKPIVLFVHGWAGRGTQFRYFFPELIKAGYRVIAFDGPAHGKSDGKRTTIIEFVEALKKIVDVFGKPQAVICHSFGGVATLMGIVNGLDVRRQINIGSPSIGNEIIKTFLKAVNGSWSTGESFRNYMVKKYGHSFDEFSGEHFIRQINDLDLLLIHDEKDKEVPMIHANRVKELYPNAILHRTSGLGHTRILKDEVVIQTCLKFIQRDG